MVISCYLQIDGKALLLETIPTYLIEHGEGERVPNEDLRPLSPAH